MKIFLYALLKAFQSLALTCRSLHYLELISVGSDVISFYPPYGYPVVPVSFIVKFTFSTLICSAILVKNQVIMHVYIYFWTLYSVPLLYFSLLAAISCYLIHCDFIIFGASSLTSCSSRVSWLFVFLFISI